MEDLISSRREDTKILASWVTLEVSPTRPVALGCPQGTPSAWSVNDAIEINAVALWGQGPQVVLVSVDTLYVGSWLEELIVSALSPVPRENILIGASHTHSAPMTDHSKPELGVPDEEHLSSLVAPVQTSMAELLDPKNCQFVTTTVCFGHAKHSISRRLKASRQELAAGSETVVMRPDWRGTTNEQVLMLELRDLEGTVRAAVWNYACHPVGFPLGDTVSAHFPGAVRSALRTKWGAGTPIVYFQGFSGDTRPRSLAVLNTPRRILGRFLRLQRRRPPTWQHITLQQYDDWLESFVATVLRISERPKVVEVTSALASRTVIHGEQFVSPPQNVSFQAIKLGKSLAIVAASAELVAEYAAPVRRMTRSALGSRWVMLVGCTDTPFGYAPTRAMLREGGYEVSGFLEPFGLDRVNPRIEESLLSGFSEVLASLGDRTDV